MANKANIQIAVTWEYWNKRNKKWQQAADPQTWNFKNLQAAIDYIPNYARTKGYEPNNKTGKEFFITANGHYEDKIMKVHKKDENGHEYIREIATKRFVRNTDSKWDNGITFYAQWINRTGKYLRRITFEQIKEVSTEWARDYHDPAPDQWSHTGTIKRGKSTIEVRTYRAEDTPDASDRKRSNRRRVKTNIEKEYRELQAMPLTKLEQQLANVENMTSRPSKGDKQALHWIRKIKKTNPTWLQYAANAQSLAEYCVKYLKAETLTLSQADAFCKDNAKYV